MQQRFLLTVAVNKVLFLRLIITASRYVFERMIKRWKIRVDLNDFGAYQ